MVLFLRCKKSTAPKAFDCQYQYDFEKTFQLKDTLSLPGCPVPFTIQYLGQDSIQIYGPQTGINVVFAYRSSYDNFLFDICEGLKVQGHGDCYQVTHFSITSVTIRIQYNIP